MKQVLLNRLNELLLNDKNKGLALLMLLDVILNKTVSWGYLVKNDNPFTFVLENNLLKKIEQHLQPTADLFADNNLNEIYNFLNMAKRNNLTNTVTLLSTIIEQEEPFKPINGIIMNNPRLYRLHK